MSETNLPSAELRALDRLVGTWAVTGGAEGTVRYEWMPGRFFLIQHVELTQFGEPVTGMELIGNLRPFGEPVGADVVSRYYDSNGNTFDYVYELAGDKLTIWAARRAARPTTKARSAPTAPRRRATGSTPAEGVTPRP